VFVKIMNVFVCVGLSEALFVSLERSGGESFGMRKIERKLDKFFYIF
jgi:hypothetical protein